MNDRLRAHLRALRAQPFVAQPRRPPWGRLATCLAASALLASSWGWPVTRAGWERLDMAVFAACDATLDWGAGWQLFWAAANHRAVDLLAMAAYGMLFACFALAGSRSSPLHRIAMGAFAIGFTALAIQASGYLFADMGRLSPSLAVEGATRLRDLVDAFGFKDASAGSFPGDHGIGVAILTTFAWLFAGRTAGLVGIAIGIVFVLPRLVVGAHWASDILVGSAAFSLAALVIVVPVQRFAVDGAARMGERLLGLHRSVGGAAHETS